MSAQSNQETTRDGAVSSKVRPIPRPVFIYGTLCAQRLLAWVLTGDASNVAAVSGLVRPARLSGFKRFTVKNCDFPTVIRHDDPCSEVDGYLLQLETPSQRKKLDDLRASCIRQIAVSVSLLNPEGKPNGEMAMADVYVWDDDIEDLSSEPWDLEAFLDERLDDWTDLYESMELIGEE